MQLWNAVCWNVVNFCVNTGLTRWLRPCLNLSCQIAMTVRLPTQLETHLQHNHSQFVEKNLGIAITTGSWHRPTPIMNINRRKLECHIFGSTVVLHLLRSPKVAKQKLCLSWETMSWVLIICTVGCFTGCKSLCKSRANEVGLGGHPPTGSANMSSTGSCIRLPQNQSWYKSDQMAKTSAAKWFSFFFSCICSSSGSVCHTKGLVMFSANFALISVSGAFSPNANLMGSVSTNYVPIFPDIPWISFPCPIETNNGHSKHIPSEWSN